MLPEEATLSSLTLLCEVPPALGLKIDFGVGLLTRAANPELAEQFLASLQSAEAASVWKTGGVMTLVP